MEKNEPVEEFLNQTLQRMSLWNGLLELLSPEGLRIYSDYWMPELDLVIVAQGQHPDQVWWDKWHFNA